MDSTASAVQNTLGQSGMVQEEVNPPRYDSEEVNTDEPGLYLVSPHGSNIAEQIVE
jgi:hypothetical protein